MLLRCVSLNSGVDILDGFGRMPVKKSVDAQLLI